MDQFQRRIPQSGRLTWIGLAAAPGAAIRSVTEAVIREGTGLDGDHHARSGTSKRQVTLVQEEHLHVVAAILRRDRVGPELVRRNLVVSGINLVALKDQRFTVGETLLEGTGPCDPCSRMEENLGLGGYTAMRGHGGITARVLRDGTIRLGDIVALAQP